MQLWFDFGEAEVKENKKKEDLPYWAAPKTDNQKLLTWQYEFVEKGDKRAIEKIYKLGLEICMKFINKFAQKNMFIKALSYEDKLEKAHNAISYVVVRYNMHPEWAIKKNYPGYLYLRVLYELFAVDKVEKQTVYMEDMIRELGGLENFENSYIFEREDNWL